MNEIPFRSDPVSGVQVIGLVVDLFMDGDQAFIEGFISLTLQVTDIDGAFGKFAENVLQAMDLDAEFELVILHVGCIIGRGFQEIEAILQVGSDVSGILQNHSDMAVLAASKALQKSGHQVVPSEQEEISCVQFKGKGFYM